MSTIKQYKIE